LKVYKDPSASSKVGDFFAPIKSVYVTSYWSSIVTLVLSCPISEILELLHTESHYFYHTPIPSGVDPWC